MTVTLNPYEGDQTALVPIGTAYSVTLGKMLDAGKTVDDSYAVLPYIRAANIQDDGLRLADVNEMPFSEDEAARLDLRRGDLLVVEGGAVGTTTVLDHDMPGWSFQKTVNRVRPISDWSTRYLGYVLRAYRDAGVIDLVCNGSTISHLTAEKLRALRIPSARPGKQRAIADYLDRETARIDTLIEEQQRLIAMLRERRQGVLSRASDGDWPTASLGLLLEGIKDGTHGSFSRTVPGEGMPLLGARNVMGSRVVLDGAESFISEEDHHSIVANGFPAKGDVLLVIVGATIGKSAVYDLDTRHAFQRSVAFLRPTDRFESKFLWYQIQARGFQDELTLRAKTSAQPGIYLGDVTAIPVVVPPLEEQRRIAAQLDEQTAKIDTLIESTERFIELARERRVALITATATGQIDVREMA